MKSDYIILGATDGIGYAVTESLLSRKIPVSILVPEREKALALFQPSEFLEVLEGDVYDLTLLKQVTEGKKFIFHGLQFPYQDSADRVGRYTENIIKAAAGSRSTIVYPGNVYNFGRTPLVKENTLPDPINLRGDLFVQIEAHFLEAVIKNSCRILIVRLPDLWGPNVQSRLIRSIFMSALKKEAFPFPGRFDIPHQFVFSRDAAAIITRLMDLPVSEPFKVYNYGGRTFQGARDFLFRVAVEAGSPRQIKRLKYWQLALYSWFRPEMMELKESHYLFENSILLDDSYVRGLFPDFCSKPLREAVVETLDWFSRHSSLIQQS